MAYDAFLKLDGVKGESQDDKHKEEIDIMSFSWGMAQGGGFGSGGGGGTGKVSVHDIAVTKAVDAASCTLMLFCCNGKHIPSGLITVRKAGENPLEYMKISLTDILISSVQHGGQGGEIMTENISLNVGKFKVDYFTQKEDGTGQPGGNMGWDVKANKKL